MKFKLQFDMDNEAFGNENPEEEVARILSDVAFRVGCIIPNRNIIKDINGNTIGRWDITYFDNP